MKLTWSRSMTSGAAAGCHVEEGFAQPGYGGDVDFPGDGHDRAALFVPDLDRRRIVHGLSPAR
jgi:hypothetical protein